MSTTTPHAPTASTAAIRISPLASTAPCSPPADSPADAATREVPKQQLYYTAMTYLLSGLPLENRAPAGTSA